MRKNQVQFQKGYSLVDFIKDYGGEEQCRQALFKWRWPDGFRCPECALYAHQDPQPAPMLKVSSPGLFD